MASARPRIRRFLTAGFLLVGFALVLVRLVNLQVLQAADLSVKAERQHRKVVTVDGSRGSILDRHGKILAMNVEVPSVFGMPTQVDDPARVARQVAPVVRRPVAEVRRKLSGSRSFVWLARKLDPDRGRQLKRINPDGVGMVMEGRRYYPKGSLLSHVLGFAGMDNQGLEGLELQYDSHLHGKKQMVVVQRDAMGRPVFPQESAAVPPSTGHNVTLTIDEVVQYIAEKELGDAVEEHGARGGTVIVMEPRTGAVLAMAINPRFDLNRVRGLTPSDWRNRAVTDVYEPGSTMKIFLAAAALEEKVMTPSTLVFCENGRMVVANTVLHDHKEMGWLTFSQVIERSSNIGSVKAAMAVGDEELYRYFRAFGFGDGTEIDLPGESAGLVKAPPAWGRRTLASVAIGQEVAVTPIQLLTATAAVANGGWLMKPYVVAEIRDGAGEVTFQAQPRVRRRPVSRETVQVLNGILERAVAEGTGRGASVPGYRVAGKTGTAQKIDPETRAYSDTLFIASFVGYVPADEPRIAIVVILDEPQGEAWGGVVAAPVFRRIAEQVLPYLGVMTRSPIEVAQELVPVG